MTEDRNSLVPFANPAPVEAYYSHPQEFDTGTAPVPLHHYAWIIRRHLWSILALVFASVLATFAVCSRLQRVYQSTTTVDIDRQAPSSIVGQDSSRMVAPSDADQFLATQERLIQSDAVLRPVAERYQLLKKEGQLAKLDPDFTARAVAAPVQLRNLTVSRPPNTYLLLISYRSPDPQLAADVANAIASSYLQHAYDLRIRSSENLSAFMQKQIDDLKARMERSSLALAAYEKELNLINPEEKTNIISARLLQLNTEYTNAQADRVRKQAAYEALADGSLPAIEISSQGEPLARVHERLNEAVARFAEIKKTYGANHPEYRKAAAAVTELQKQFDDTRTNIAQRLTVEYHEALSREQMLQKAVGETKAESDQINSRSFQYQQLKQEAAADKTLYDELVRKINEAGINSGFQNNNIRIADLARPNLRPVSPRVTLALAVVFMLSSFLGVGGAVLLDLMDTSVRDSEQVSRYLRTDVIGVLPAVRNSHSLQKKATTSGDATALQTDVEPRFDYRKGGYRTASGFEEAVRTIRTTILLGEFESPHRSILLTSANPAEGKTTIAVHLAIAHAEQGHKTLLVDSDLRRPSVHLRFDISPTCGLSSVLTNERPWRDAIFEVPGRSNLSVLPAGPPSHRAADLIGSRMSDLLDELAKEYDFIILDAPPLLGFAESLQLATAVDGVLVIGRAGQTKRKALATVITTLRRVRAHVVGIVLNDMKRNSSSDGYAYYGYHRGSYYYQNRDQ